MAFTTLARDIFKISGPGFGPGAVIPAGTVLTRVTLTTVDEDTGPLGPLNLQIDPYTLGVGEAVSLLIDGVAIAGTLPSLFATQVTTDAGPIRALAFTIDGTTYLIPRANQNLDGVSIVTASASINTGAVPSLSTGDYGLLPENANTFGGQVFVEYRFGASVLDSFTRDFFLYDADAIRGNADSAGEEIAFAAPGAANGPTPSFRVGEAREVAATVRFDDGGLLTLSAVVTVSNGPYGESTAQYLFDDAALAQSGRTVSDVAQVVASIAADHALNWEQLGFTLLASGTGTPTPDPTPELPINDIIGTSRRDVLVGTDGRDAIFGRAGADTLSGGGDSDAFVFGSETRNGKRETDQVLDYQVGLDIIAFEDGVNITSVRNIAGGVSITFEGDRKSVV